MWYERVRTAESAFTAICFPEFFVDYIPGKEERERGEKYLMQKFSKGLSYCATCGKVQQTYSPHEHFNGNEHKK